MNTNDEPSPRRYTAPTPEQIEERRVAKIRELQEATEAFEASRGAFVTDYLTRAGITSYEQTAAWEQVPAAIQEAFPVKWAGFGLVGSFGAGKTFALAAALKRHTERAVARKVAAMIEEGDAYRLRSAVESRWLPLAPWPLWCNWPGESAAHRAQLFRGGHADAEDWILNLQDPDRLVVLDDIGADRPTAQDWTGDVLARVVDDRLRRHALTVWTSNLDAKGLVERYGPRTYSRLMALAPMIQLPRLPDLRLKRQGAA